MYVCTNGIALSCDNAHYTQDSNSYCQYIMSIISAGRIVVGSVQGLHVTYQQYTVNVQEQEVTATNVTG